MKLTLTWSALALGIATLLGGCASHAPVTLALTDLGSASKMEYGADNLRFMRSVTIHGLGGEEVVGMLTKDPDPPVFDFALVMNYLRIGSKDMPDSLAPRVANTCSKVLEIVFDGEATASDPATVANLRDGVLKLERSIADELRAELDLLLVESLGTRLAAAGDADKQKSIDAFSAAWPRLGVNDEATLRAAHTRLRGELDVQQGRSKKLRAELDAALATPGIVITRWARAKKSAFGVGSAVGSAGASRDREVTGFLILGAPRVSTLMIGDDLVYRLRQVDRDGQAAHRDGVDAYFKSKRLYTSIYQLRAKTLAYAESQSEALAASLQADLKLAAEKLNLIAAQPGGKVSNLLQGLDVKVRAEFARATELGTGGLLKAKEVNMYDFRFHRDDAYAESVRAELVRARGYRPIYSARATLDRIEGESATLPKMGKEAVCTEPVDLAKNLLDTTQAPVAMSHVEKTATAAMQQLLGGTGLRLSDATKP